MDFDDMPDAPPAAPTEAAPMDFGDEPYSPPPVAPEADDPFSVHTEAPAEVPAEVPEAPEAPSYAPPPVAYSPPPMDAMDAFDTPAMDAPAMDAPAMDAYDTVYSPPAAPEPVADAFEMIPDAGDSEPNALDVFMKEWNFKLEEKKVAEEEKEADTVAQAKAELAEWKTQRDMRLTTRKETNRTEEQVMVETLESEADCGNTWDRVTKLIDTAAEAAESGKSDVTRMRKLFIHLKNEPLEKTRISA